MRRIIMREGVICENCSRKDFKLEIDNGRIYWTFQGERAKTIADENGILREIIATSDFIKRRINKLKQ